MSDYWFDQRYADAYYALHGDAETTGEENRTACCAHPKCPGGFLCCCHDEGEKR
jgi:hypothetical protein